jgi:hypothetical protein
MTYWRSAATGATTICGLRAHRSASSVMRALRSDGDSSAPTVSSRGRSSATVSAARAEVVGQVGEGALGDVGGRHDDEHLPAQRAVQPGQQIRPRRRGRLVQREREPALGGRAQPLDQLTAGLCSMGGQYRFGG